MVAFYHHHMCVCVCVAKCSVIPTLKRTRSSRCAHFGCWFMCVTKHTCHTIHQPDRVLYGLRPKYYIHCKKRTQLKGMDKNAHTHIHTQIYHPTDPGPQQQCCYFIARKWIILVESITKWLVYYIFASIQVTKCGYIYRYKQKSVAYVWQLATTQPGNKLPNGFSPLLLLSKDRTLTTSIPIAHTHTHKYR